MLGQRPQTQRPSRNPQLLLRPLPPQSIGWISEADTAGLAASAARMTAALSSDTPASRVDTEETESAGETGTTPRAAGFAPEPPDVPPLLPLMLLSLLRVTAGGSGAIIGSFCCRQGAEQVSQAGWCHGGVRPPNTGGTPDGSACKQQSLQQRKVDANAQSLTAKERKRRERRQVAYIEGGGGAGGARVPGAAKAGGAIQADRAEGAVAGGAVEGVQ